MAARSSSPRAWPNVLRPACCGSTPRCKRVEQSDAGVVVRHAGGEVHASRLVIAAAPALVSRIHFHSALPAARTQLQQRMPMGSVIKALIAYERPFWKERGLSG